MRYMVRALFVLLLLSSPFTGQTGNWKKYSNTNGNFSVLFPGAPQDNVNKKDDKVDSHTLMAVEKPVYYTVVYTSMVDGQNVDDTSFNAFRDAVFKELPKCQVDTEQPASPVVDGFIGHSYRLSCAMTNARLVMTGNLYWGKHYAYAVMAMFPDGITPPEAVKMFVESFSVVNSAQ
ncbi:MAG: hypothetical protein ACM3SW_13110 [Actinomycetota bacterium]